MYYVCCNKHVHYNSTDIKSISINHIHTPVHERCRAFCHDNMRQRTAPMGKEQLMVCVKHDVQVTRWTKCWNFLCPNPRHMQPLTGPLKISLKVLKQSFSFFSTVTPSLPPNLLPKVTNFSDFFLLLSNKTTTSTALFIMQHMVHNIHIKYAVEACNKNRLWVWILYVLSPEFADVISLQFRWTFPTWCH